MGSIRLGVDIGGTFTDITVLDQDTGKVTIAKVSSRRRDPAGALIEAVERGLSLAAVAPEDVTLLVHGSTLVTNAVLENKLPRCALVTTAGFRDVLEIGRHFRPDMYDLMQDKPPPIVPRERRYCIDERTSPCSSSAALRPRQPGSLEFVSGRAVALGLTDAPPMHAMEARPEAGPVAVEHRPVYFDEARGYMETAIHDRGALGPGHAFAGPAVVEQMDTTTVVHPGQRVQVDGYGNLMIST